MGILENLYPEDVFYYFEEITKIPRGSGNTDKIRDFLLAFAKEKNLYARTDGFNNVIIKKPASPGYEGHAPILLQGHTDMVTQKDEGIERDLETDGLDIAKDGDYIYAKGTTLGGDDGIAVAYCMAVLADDTLPHPPLEILLTTDEETGMFGADGVDVSDISARTMLNLDSEEEGEFLVACAGGGRVNIDKVLCKDTNKYTNSFRIKFSGFLGGHSGQEIDKGRANSNKFAVSVLEKLTEKFAFSVASLCGGDKDNAIPRETTAVICTDENAEDVKSALLGIFEKERESYRETDGGIAMEIAECEAAESYPSGEILPLLSSLPNGIIAMEEHIEGLVKTSLNMGILFTEPGRLHCSFSVRSSSNDDKFSLIKTLENIAEKHGAVSAVSGIYPAWEYREDSPLREKMIEIFERMYGKKPLIMSMHAGLECGLFCEKMPGLDCVSIGPDMKDIHTTMEKLSVSSVARTYDFIKEILKAM